MAKNSFEESETRRENRPGRPFAIEDAWLTGSRDHLAWLLDVTWGVVGWELQQIKTAADVQNALAVWKESQSNYTIKTLLRPTEARANPKELRATRRRLWRANEATYQAREARDKYRELLERMERASSMALSTEARQIENERQNRKQALRDAEAEYVQLTEEREGIETTLLDMEAGFARHELARFCQSPRYRKTPLIAANAMAGLPFIGWRQSMKRCQRVECPLADGMHYQIFKVLRRLVNSCPDREHLISHVEAWLGGSGSTESYAVSHLRDKWYYLRRATQAVQEENFLSKQLPFAILSEFHYRTGHPSSADHALEEAERIIPKPSSHSSR